jgi:DNA-binding MarR family transcriptional regulator
VEKPAERERAAPDFELESHVFYLFTQIMGRRDRTLQQLLEPFGVSMPQWRILAVLQVREGCTMNELADVTTVDRTTLTRALDRLERDGLVTRQSDTRDRRNVRLGPTAAGRDAFHRVLPTIAEQNERALAGFTAAEGAALRALLHRMLRNLDAEYDRRNAGWQRDREEFAEDRGKGKA